MGKSHIWDSMIWWLFGKRSLLSEHFLAGMSWLVQLALASPRARVLTQQCLPGECFSHPHGHYGNSGSLPTFLSSTLPWFPPPWSTWWSTRHPLTLPPSLPSAPPLSLTYSDALCVEKVFAMRVFCSCYKENVISLKTRVIIIIWSLLV